MYSRLVSFYICCQMYQALDPPPVQGQTEPFSQSDLSLSSDLTQGICGLHRSAPTCMFTCWGFYSCSQLLLSHSLKFCSLYY